MTAPTKRKVRLSHEPAWMSAADARAVLDEIQRDRLWLAQWALKYMAVRIDMRTGSMLLGTGNNQASDPPMYVIGFEE